VFIAVIIETFAEIRVQFQQMWGARGQEAQIEHKQVDKDFRALFPSIFTKINKIIIIEKSNFILKKSLKFIKIKILFIVIFRKNQKKISK
jgi:hypothetical protein